MAKQETPTPEDPSRSRTTPSNFDLQEQIRLRAYEISEQRGREHGHEIDDWLQAEWELSQQSQRKIAA